ncbi:ras-like protein [Anaeramoeba flamelloides]|uniref:Ras-like protein n=1 Tax=Anaeramoeba flamelloides TaxID=1746091 RepID=A0AAV8A049_9EUKA|nr:ras-like protein [Anaeramoeba flamelloides]
MTDNEEKHSIVLLGSGSVGKSCLVIHFLQNRFVQDYDPTVEESYSKMVIIDNKPAVLELIDTAGQDEYTTTRDKYIRSGEGFILVFSVTSRSSWNKISEIYTKIRRIKEVESPPAILLANKSDLENDRIVTRDEGEEFSKKYNLNYFETSAKAGINIKSSFEEIVRVIRDYKRTIKKKEERKKKRDQDQDSDKSGCCQIL